MEISLLSNDARSSLSALRDFDTSFRKTSERLATGLKINRASDNPSSFFTASALRNRASDLNRVLDTVSNKLGAVQAAHAGIRSLEKLIGVAQSIVNSAAALPEPRPTATGSVAVRGETDVTSLAGVSDGDQFSVQVGGAAAVTVTINAGDTPDQLLAELNAIDNVQASFTSSGAVQIATTNGEDLTLSEVAGTPLSGLGIGAGTLDAASAISPARAAKAAEFDAIRTQISQLAGDASFLGINLLGGDNAKINFNETSSLTLAGTAGDASGLGIAGAANDFSSASDISAARSNLTGALNSLRSFSSSLSTGLAVADIRSDFTASLMNTLVAGADRLTLADLNEEGANLRTLQTRSGLAAASFSIVQRSESNVLRLFG